jgi:hypothetical protein
MLEVELRDILNCYKGFRDNASRPLCERDLRLILELEEILEQDDDIHFGDEVEEVPREWRVDLSAENLSAVGQLAYRYENSTYQESGIELIELHKYEVVKLTQSGAWIVDELLRSERRFVLANARKRYAWPTIEAAQESYFRRKRVQAGTLKRQLAGAKHLLELARQRQFATRDIGFEFRNRMESES